MTEADLIKQKIRKHMNELADDIALGCAKDFPEYRYLVGMIAGLALIESDVNDMLQRRDED